jgi:molecular chaperone HtpG
VKKYSNYIAFPIELDSADADKKPDDKPEVLNSTKAIWTRSKSDVTEAEYQEFYKGQFHDYREPMHVIPFSAEGATEFRALLFIPSHAPWDVFSDPENRGLHLYVKRVFIMNNCPDLIPAWMRFVKGVVDSADLPLNVSREILQDSALVRRIQKSLVSRVLNELKDLREKNADKYRTFHEQFGRLLREGLHADRDNAEKLKELLLFETSASEAGKPVFFKDVADRVQPDQKAFYYISANSRAAAEASPLLEPFRARKLEVIFFTDAADEYIIPDLGEYAGKKFVSVQDGAKDLDSEEEKKSKETARKDAEAKYGDLLKKIQELLKDDIREARFSDRLTDSACCLVAEGGLGPHMERYLRMQGGGDANSTMFKRVLELNPAHPVLAKMESFRAENPEHAALADYAALLRDQALLLEGSPAKEPARFARLVSRLMVESR